MAGLLAAFQLRMIFRTPRRSSYRYFSALYPGERERKRDVDTGKPNTTGNTPNHTTSRYIYTYNLRKPLG